MKPKKVLLLAVLSGIMTTVLFYIFINNTAATDASEQQPAEMTSVVIATEDIPEFQQVQADQVTIKEIPAEQAHPEMIQDMNAALNKYTTADIKQGEIFMNHRIQTKEEEKSVVSRKINKGYRAVSAEVSYVNGVSNLIQPEDYVDVTVTPAETLKTEIVLEKIRVLAVGERMTEKTEEGAEPVLYQSVTLELNQADTVKLIESSAHGELQLALYSKSDLETEKAEDEEQTKDETSQTSGKVVTLPAESVIRSSPSLLAQPIEIVEQETTLSLLGEQKTDGDGRIWLEIETESKAKGWVSSRIIKGEQE
ncbi:Flp pilus assembly protein CpaB [Oceanobacillus massiliensis]|uniref:Flp pilus assembly protein CpaB n=1 Tax=Oceanobacillus massiliensis TaxID=1465765 RepID=UPI0002880287|nr:Flp pilus assembly protein CpaB [Oceanobacillus massiliensis]